VSDPDGPPRANDDEASRFEVLDVFGLKLEVKNPRMAELLTMGVKDAMTTDLREFGGSSGSAEHLRDEIAQAAPDVALAPPSRSDEIDAQGRRDFRSRADALAARLGFSATPDGLWSSQTEGAVLTRMVDTPVSIAAASHYVTQVEPMRERLAGPAGTVLFVVAGPESVEAFLIAIRQRHLHGAMRVVSIEDLVRVADACTRDGLDHHRAHALLSPAEGIDVASMLPAPEGEGRPVAPGADPSDL
jgi:hypothetical protein